MATIGSIELEQQTPKSAGYWSLIVGSIGVVFGDIGTSPLYAFHEAIKAARGSGISDHEAVIGVLSLVLWALTIIVTIKYVLVLLRIDNKGEGGTFALMALGQSIAARSAPLILMLGIAGAAFFYGDAVITPAISVLSAVEGLSLVTPSFESVVLPLTILVLISLFVIQSRGTDRIAYVFGPLMVVWFFAIALGGLAAIALSPVVLQAINPIPGAEFAVSHGTIGLTVLGLVFLAVTGAEALYADLGHFGRSPISFAWLWIVFPSLALNYLGQGALVLSDSRALENPFFRLYPHWALLPMVILATIATVIASQAVISGAFSLTRQAIQLGLIPRLEIMHTSKDVKGQIYLPRINWLLMLAVIYIVLVFRTSSNLAAAYGVSVTATMLITSCMAFYIVRYQWRWSTLQSAGLIVPLLLIETTFFAANITKIVQGGWLPLSIAALIALVMTTWSKGVAILRRELFKTEADLEWLLRKLQSSPPPRVPGTAIFLTPREDAVPTSLLHNLKHNRILHERNIVLTIRAEEAPHVPSRERVSVERLDDAFVKVVANYGFMETPSISKIFNACRRKSLNVDINAASFFVSRLTMRPSLKSELQPWRQRLFIFLFRHAEDATTYFQIPTDRAVEIGVQLSI